MNIEALIEQIESIDWLNRSGHISEIYKLQFEWEWLPTSRDQEDPFEVTYTAKSEQEIRVKDAEKLVYKTALRSLRSIGEAHPKLVDGSNNYTESMKGGALFACKRAAKEVLCNQPGKWLEIFELYKNGVWPCGITKAGEIVTL